MSGDPTMDGTGTYLVRPAGTDFIKIGNAVKATVKKRLQSIQVGFPQELEIVGVHPNPHFEEYAHEQLSEHRVRGEWFQAAATVEFWKEHQPNVLSCDNCGSLMWADYDGRCYMKDRRESNEIFLTSMHWNESEKKTYCDECCIGGCNLDEEQQSN